MPIQGQNCIVKPSPAPRSVNCDIGDATLPRAVLGSPRPIRPWYASKHRSPTCEANR